MEIKDKEVELHVKVTVDDVDQAVRDWFASRGFTGSPNRWVKMREKKPPTNWIYLLSMLDHDQRWVMVAEWNKQAETWESIQTGEPFHEDEMERVQAWMQLPEPYREDNV